jgi:hypothetical protein
MNKNNSLEMNSMPLPSHYGIDFHDMECAATLEVDFMQFALKMRKKGANLRRRYQHLFFMTPTAKSPNNLGSVFGGIEPINNNRMSWLR